MRIKIHCRKCKDESLLTTTKTLSLSEAKEIIGSIEEVISRHRYHPDSLEIFVFESEGETKNYVYDALSDRIKKHAYR